MRSCLTVSRRYLFTSDIFLFARDPAVNQEPYRLKLHRLGFYSKQPKGIFQIGADDSRILLYVYLHIKGESLCQKIKSLKINHLNLPLADHKILYQNTNHLLPKEEFLTSFGFIP